MTIVPFDKHKKTRKRPTAPAGLSAKFKRLYQDLVSEKISLSGAVTDADLEMIGSATLAAQGEATCRQIAAKLLKEGRHAGYMTFSKQAQSEHRQKSAALGRVGLTGDRRGASQEKIQRASLAAGIADPDDEWSDIP